MAQIKCKLFCHSLSRHVHKLYTGFSMLSENGLIDITQEIRPHSNNCTKRTRYLKYAAHAHLVVEISSQLNQALILYFDNLDGMGIDKYNLQFSDIYFKRSFSRKYINEFSSEHKEKIYPLGFYYPVLPNRSGIMTLYRNVSLSKSVVAKLGGVLSSIDTKNRIKFYPRLRNLHSLPTYWSEPKVLFMVTAYDPYDDPKRPKAKIAERIYNNEFRANCVRALRRELGSNFYGGFIHNEYTTEKYKDVLLDDPKKSTKKNYLLLLNKFPICIATTGLHGSIGAKLGEYVAFSKAIVSEKLQHEVPGQFQPEHNYLEFSSPEDCVKQSIRLLTDKQLRTKLMRNNSIYYQHYVRPDMLVFNAISLALEKLNERNA